MGFNIILEDEAGAQVEQLDDSRNLLKAVLPSPQDTSFHQLRFIDPYGDTVFNRPQMQPFIEEWERIASKARSADEQDLVGRIREIAKRCSEEAHLYLRFRGE